MGAAGRRSAGRPPGARWWQKEVVLVDTSLANYQSLEAVVRDGVAIVEFDGSADGLAQIAAWAAGQSGLDAIHIFSHGSDGQLYLGSTLLTNASLPDVRVQAALSQLGSALQVNGDLLLYGCDLAHSFVGQNFLQQLSQATGQMWQLPVIRLAVPCWEATGHWNTAPAALRPMSLPPAATKVCWPRPHLILRMYRISRYLEL